MSRGHSCLLLALALGTGCGDEGAPDSLAWRIDFASPGLAARAVVVEARVLRGDCTSGDELFVTELRRGAGGAMTTALSDLPPGRYAFAASARDDTCQVFAGGCTAVALPGSTRTVVTVVDALERATPACAPDECSAGICAVDAGPPPELDAGPPPELDAGPLDAGCSDADRSCTDGTLRHCVDGRLTSTPCALGCSASEPRCASVRPANLVMYTPDPAAGDLVVAGAIVQSTETCAGAHAGTLMEIRGDGPACVLSVRNVDIAAGAILRVVGSRPLIIVASGDVTVSGIIDVSAGGTMPGAGGAMPGAGPAPGVAGRIASAADDWQNGGGGGGGLCGAGGRGGDGRGGTGGAGGPPYAVAGLYGGSGGGAGAAQDDSSRAPGGAGGGALQITAGGTLTISGRVLAGGGGGGGADSGGGAGGGGGSGGMIVLEAPAVIVAGPVHAIGGGGGGSRGTTNPGMNGADGATAGDFAAGGAGGEAGNSWPGGRSGGGTTVDDRAGSPGGGSISGTAPPRGGGGGGGAGCILLGTLDGSPPPGAGLLRPGFMMTYSIGRD